jgi:hypothetical protein
VATRRLGHLSSAHPVATVAARHCEAHRGALRRSGIGGVACGACWERAIRDDEQVAVEFGLPRDTGADPTYVDEIAVEFVCRGEDHPLTPVERAEVVRRLDTAGAGPGTIAVRLGLSVETVHGILTGLAEAIDLVPAAPPLAAHAADDETAVA